MSSSVTNPFKKHSHSKCINEALRSAEKLCGEKNIQLTALRKRVLELIWSSHKALGAYAILELLGQEGVKPAPPTVYRALEFLLNSGLIHRINSLNAFIGCTHITSQHIGTYFLICKNCNNIQEVQDNVVDKRILALAERNYFSVSTQALEISGLCQSCQQNSP